MVVEHASDVKRGIIRMPRSKHSNECAGGLKYSEVRFFYPKPLQETLVIGVQFCIDRAKKIH